MRQVEREDVQRIIETINVKKILDKTFLITGATGSLARYCVLTLLEIANRNPDHPCKVLILCRNIEKANKVWAEFCDCDNICLIEGDVEHPVEYEGDINYIIHAACVSNSSFFNTNPVEIISANVVGTYNMLMLAREKKVEGFLFFSSGAVFGGATKDDVTYNGLDPLDYKNCYSISKRMGENLCACFAEEYSVPAKIVRIGYTFGPHINLEDGHLYSDFVKAIVEKKDLIISGTGQQFIGLLYVTDAISAFFKILFDGKERMPYVIRNYKEQITIEDLAIMLTEKVFPERNLTYKCMREKTGIVQKPIVKDPVLVRQLGWQICVSMEEGFKRTVTCIEERMD